MSAAKWPAMFSEFSLTEVTHEGTTTAGNGFVHYALRIRWNFVLYRYAEVDPMFLGRSRPWIGVMNST